MNIETHKSIPNDILKIDDPDFRQENVCIVTSCGSILGRAVAIAAAVNNLMVVGADTNVVDAEKTAETAQALGGMMRVVRADMRKNRDIERVVDAAEISGAIKFLANIASVFHSDIARKMPLEQYDFTEPLMLRAPYYLSLLVIPQMKQRPEECGVIINMASIQAHDIPAEMPVMNIIDAGLQGLNRAVSSEGNGSVRSFTAGAGFVKTFSTQDRNDGRTMKSGMISEHVVVDMLKGKRRIMMNPTDVANLFIFGFSRNSTHLAGEDLLPEGSTILHAEEAGVEGREANAYQ